MINTPMMAPQQGRIEIWAIKSENPKTIYLSFKLPLIIDPRFYDNASWNPDAVTVFNTPSPFYVFINTKNTVYIGDNTAGNIQAWAEGSTTPTRSFQSGFAPFVTSNEDVFVWNANERIDWWEVNATSGVALMFIGGKCQSLFVDMNQYSVLLGIQYKYGPLEVTG